MRNSLQQALEQQHTHLSRLTEILDSELRLISGRDPEALMALLKEKELLIDAIVSQDSEVAGLYQQAKDNNLLDDSIAVAIDKAKRLMATCQFQTSINEKALEQSRLKVDHLRNLILASKSKESMLYNKKGKTIAGASGKGISA